MAAADAAMVARLLEISPSAQVVVPRLEEDIHDLRGLAALAERLQG
jgi:hypothetical protein